MIIYRPPTRNWSSIEPFQQNIVFPGLWHLSTLGGATSAMGFFNEKFVINYIKEIDISLINEFYRLIAFHFIFNVFW